MMNINGWDELIFLEFHLKIGPSKCTAHVTYIETVQVPCCRCV